MPEQPMEPQQITISKGVKCRIQIDDITNIMEINSSDVYASYTRWSNNHGFKQVDLEAGSHTIDLDFCSAFTGKSVKIRRARIEIRRV